MKRYGVDKNSLVLAYRANILSVVKYVAPAWYPYVTKNSKLQLESIQKLALKAHGQGVLIAWSLQQN